LVSRGRIAALLTHADPQLSGIPPFNGLGPLSQAVEELSTPLVDRFEDDSIAFAADDDLVLVIGKPERLRQSHRLAPSVSEDFGAFYHVKYIHEYIRVVELGV
jgi:hypothetical protein